MMKNLVPFAMDNPDKKTHSILSKWELMEDTLEEAIKGKQLNPVIK